MTPIGRALVGADTSRLDAARKWNGYSRDDADGRRGTMPGHGTGYSVRLADIGALSKFL